MKRHSRPFTVEVRSRRKPTDSAAARRDVTVNHRPAPAYPLDAMSTGLAMANTASATATRFGDLAPSVFGLQRAAEEVPTSTPAAQPRRILPSLLPPNPLVEDAAQDLGRARTTKGSRTKNKGKPARPEKAAGPVGVRSEPTIAPVVEIVPPEAPNEAQEALTTAIQVRRASKWKRAGAALPRSEKWKRRLPAVCR